MYGCCTVELLTLGWMHSTWPYGVLSHRNLRLLGNFQLLLGLDAVPWGWSKRLCVKSSVGASSAAGRGVAKYAEVMQAFA